MCQEEERQGKRIKLQLSPHCPRRSCQSKPYLRINYYEYYELSFFPKRCCLRSIRGTTDSPHQGSRTQPGPPGGSTLLCPPAPGSSSPSKHTPNVRILKLTATHPPPYTPSHHADLPSSRPYFLLDVPQRRFRLLNPNLRFVAPLYDHFFPPPPHCWPERTSAQAITEYSKTRICCSAALLALSRRALSTTTYHEPAQDIIPLSRQFSSALLTADLQRDSTSVFGSLLAARKPPIYRYPCDSPETSVEGAILELISEAFWKKCGDRGR